jgi:hypothetical protein
VARPRTLAAARWPGERLYVIADNFSPRTGTPKVCTHVVHGQRGRVVFLPAYASWLNWIEAERHFVLNGTDRRSHDERNGAIDAYIRWRNARAQPKAGFATDLLHQTRGGSSGEVLATRCGVRSSSIDSALPDTSGRTAGLSD